MASNLLAMASNLEKKKRIITTNDNNKMKGLKGLRSVKKQIFIFYQTN